MTFSLVLWHELADEINRLPDKTWRIIKTALKQLEEDRSREAGATKKNWFYAAALYYTGFTFPAVTPYFTRLIPGKNW